MAAKKSIPKKKITPPKKKLTAPKKGAKNTVSGKLAKAPPKKLSKPAPKKLVAPKMKPQVKKLSAPLKAKVEKDYQSDYRKMRKYTAPKLLPLIAEDNVPKIRARIRSDVKGPLQAHELVKFLMKTEQEIPEWKARRLPLPNGEKRRRGRPPKNPDGVRKVKAKAPRKAADPKATLAAAKAGKLLPPKKKLTAPPPKKLVAAPKKAITKLNGAPVKLKAPVLATVEA